MWADDAHFGIAPHVRARPVPAPGDEAALLAVCPQLNEPPLDRSRPLWELWLLPGLADGTIGMLIRLHHAVADGIAAIALMGALLDTTPAPPPPAAPPFSPRLPRSVMESPSRNTASDLAWPTCQSASVISRPDGFSPDDVPQAARAGLGGAPAEEPAPPEHRMRPAHSDSAAVKSARSA